MSSTAIARLCRTVQESQDWTFTTAVTEINLNLGGDYFHRGKASVTWSLEIDAREWGIKDLMPVIKDFTIDYVEEVYDEPNDEDIEIPHRVVMAQLSEFEIDVNFRQREDFASISIAPEEIEVDDRRKKIVVTF